MIAFSTLQKEMTVDFRNVFLKAPCETISDHRVQCMHPDREGLMTHSSYKCQFLRPFVPVHHCLEEGKPSPVHLLNKALCTHHVQIKVVFFL